MYTSVYVMYGDRCCLHGLLYAGVGVNKGSSTQELLYKVLLCSQVFLFTGVNFTCVAINMCRSIQLKEDGCMQVLLYPGVAVYRS